MKLRLLFGDHVLGPGKAELLERIQASGSISAAGREMKMSYKRAWMLVEEMNNTFREPLVESARGGSGGGGAHLTSTGVAVLGHFRAVESAAMKAGTDDVEALRGLLRDIPEQK